MRYGPARVALLAGVATVTATASAAKVWTLQLGSTFAVKGQTRSLPGKSVRATGGVVVVKSWDGGKHRLITTALTDSHGRYQVAIKLTRRGLLTLRIIPPDKHVLQSSWSSGTALRSPGPHHPACGGGGRPSAH
jgi:hypothetical protein